MLMLKPLPKSIELECQGRTKTLAFLRRSPDDSNRQQGLKVIGM